MKKALCAWAFPADWSLERCAASVQKAGFDGVELIYALKGLITPHLTAQEARRIWQVLTDHGLQVASLSTGVFWGPNLLSPDPDERAVAKGHVRAMLRIAHDLGTDAILVVPGYMHSAKTGGPVVPDYEAAFGQAVTELQGLARDAETMDVHIGVENVWNYFLTSALELRQFIDAVASPYVNAYFDVGNVMRTGFPEHWIRILGHRIVRVHLKDYRRAGHGAPETFVDLLEGDVDYGAVMTALREVGYDGWCTAEVGSREEQPEAYIRRTGRDMGRILQE